MSTLGAPGRGTRRESLASSIALITYNNTGVAIEKGATFIFSSWICIADGIGGFTNYLVESVSSLLHSGSSPDALGDLIDKLSKLEIADPILT
jgi:hypothetical protein